MDNLISYYLNIHFQQRMGKNSRFSLRAFASELKVSPSFLSDVLRGNKGISPTRAASMARLLKFPTQQASLFCDFAAANYSRSAQARKSAQTKMTQSRDLAQKCFLDAERFQVISEWYHLAILESCQLEGFNPSFGSLAELLMLPKPIVISACERLKTLELLRIDDESVFVTGGSVHTECKTPSEAIKKFHVSLIQKSLTALENVDVKSREYHSMILSIDRTNFEKSAEIMSKNSQKLMEELEGSGSRKDVYALTIQLFPLSQSQPEGGAP